MRSYVPFVAAVLVVAAAPARADEKEGAGRSHRLPLNPFTKAKAGDFSVLEGTLKSQTRDEKVRLRWEVVSVLDDAVTVSMDRLTTRTKATVEFDPEKAPTLTRFFGFEGRTVSGVQVSDDKREVKDRTFACKKVTFTAGEGRSFQTVTAWLCADVPASRLVALASEDEYGSRLEVSVTSFGNGHEEAWSALPAGEKAEGEFWRDAGIGSVVETRVVTDMKKPVEAKSESVMKQKLKAKDGNGYTLETEFAVGDMTMPATDQVFPWLEKQRAEPPPPDTKVEDLGVEDLKVGTETYRCKHVRTESVADGMKTMTESWTHRGLVIKGVSKNENLTSTIEATRITNVK